LALASRDIGVDQRTNRVLPGRDLLVRVSGAVFVSLVVQIAFVVQVFFLVTHAATTASRRRFTRGTTTFASG